MVTSFTKLRLFSHKFSSIAKTIFTPLRETLSAGRVKLLAEASELLTHIVATRKVIFLKIYFGLSESICNCNGPLHSVWMLYSIYQMQYYCKQGGRKLALRYLSLTLSIIDVFLVLDLPSPFLFHSLQQKSSGLKFPKSRT